MADEGQAGSPSARAGGDEQERVAMAASAIATVAKTTASDVDGVTRLASTLPQRVKRAFGAGFPGIAVEFVSEDEVRIDVHLAVRYGESLPTVAGEVRRVVAERVQRVSGVGVKDVVVHVDHVECDGA